MYIIMSCRLSENTVTEKYIKLQNSWSSTFIYLLEYNLHSLRKDTTITASVLSRHYCPIYVTSEHVSHCNLPRFLTQLYPMESCLVAGHSCTRASQMKTLKVQKKFMLKNDKAVPNISAINKL
jgi:hypothetical protein